MPSGLSTRGGRSDFDGAAFARCKDLDAEFSTALGCFFGKPIERVIIVRGVVMEQKGLFD